MQTLRGNRAFSTFWAAYVVSLLGDWSAAVALASLATELTRSGFAIALVTLTFTVPPFAVFPVAGAVLDGVQRWRVLALADVLAGFAALGLFFVKTAGLLWVALLLSAVIAALGALWSAGAQAILPELVAPDDLPRANALIGTTWAVTFAVGSLVGGLGTRLWGPGAMMLFNLQSFLVSGALVASMRWPASAPRARLSTARPLRDLADGIRYAHRQRDVRSLLLAKAGFGVAAGATALLPVLATTRYHAGPTGVGLLLAGRGAGAFVGPWLASRIGASGSQRAGPVPLAALLVVLGVGYSAVGLMPAVWAAAVAVACAHVGGSALWVRATIDLQATTPADWRGRTFAIDGAMTGLAMSVSIPASGLLANALPPGAVVALVGLATASFGIALGCWGKAAASLQTSHIGAGGVGEQGESGSPLAAWNARMAAIYERPHAGQARP